MTVVNEDEDKIEYDDDGNPIEPEDKEIEYDEDGNPIEPEIEYDDDGNPIEPEVEYDEDGNPIQPDLEDDEDFDEEGIEDDLPPEEVVDPEDELRPFLTTIYNDTEEEASNPIGFKLAVDRSTDQRFVTFVTPESRAEVAGFQVGDRILGINGELLYKQNMKYMSNLIRSLMADQENIEFFVVSQAGMERFNACHITPKYYHIDLPPPKLNPMTIDEIEELQAKEDNCEIVLPEDKYTMDETDERGAMPNDVFIKMAELKERDIPTPDSVDPYDYTIMNLFQLKDLITASKTRKKIEFEDWQEALDTFEEL